MGEEIKEAVTVLQDGGVVVFPTDTAYGIGARIDDSNAVERVFRVKKRDFTKAVPILVADPQMAKKYAVVTRKIRHLMDVYWPGALTLVLPATSEDISPLIKKNNTIGLRMPAKKEILEIISAVGVPIIGTSANFAGEKTPYSYEELDPVLVKRADFVLQGNCVKGISSTVLDASRKPWRILRQGPVTIEINE